LPEKREEERVRMKVKEDKIEYEAVRNEIIRVQNSITNETIYMYVTYITLFSIGFSYSWFFLASFIMLIVFQGMINENQWELKKMSTFLKVFFEERYDDLHWERLHAFKYYRTIRNIRENKVEWKLYKWSASFLAFISLLFLIFTTFKQVEADISTYEILILTVGFCLFFLTIHINSSFNHIDEERDTMLRDCIEEYLKSIDSNR